jgi:uncharacterized protein YecE (DUF72 family)
MNIRIGTSGYSFNDWKGAFYPPKIAAASMLEFYAARFDVVEVNATYYRMPPPSVFRGIAKRTPPGFGFTVKLHKSMTHDRKPQESDFKALEACLEPLAEQGKLLGLLAQFPYSFRDTRDNRDYIVWLRGRLAAHPLHVEFRHASWINKEGVAFLERNGAGFCMVDEPQLEGLAPPLVAVAGDVAYVRFHGRNAIDWWRPRPGSDRYLYDYSGEELAEWTPRVKQAAAKAKSTLVFFNNCHFGHAPKNAVRFREMLELPEPETQMRDGELPF